jgi:NADH:ubiquinone oxidoreductase subunit F (NADH-binding)
MLQLLEKIHSGKGSMDDIEAIREICQCMKTASLCGLGQTAPNPVLSTLKYFEEEYLDLINKAQPQAKRGLNLPTAGSSW